MSTRRSFRRALTGLAALAAAAPLACTDESVTAVEVATIEISPEEATLYPDQERQFSAVARDGSGNTLPGRTVQWSSDDTDVASVDDAGLVTAHAPGTATITAASDEITGTAAVTVEYRSAIVLGDAAITMGGQAGASTASARSVEITGEGGDVTDLSLSVGYADGEPDGWLEAAFSDGNTSTPTTLLLQASPADLSEGSYHATVEVGSNSAGNSPQVLEVTFEVVAQVSPEASPATSTIDADPQSITADGSTTSAVTVTLRNAGGAVLEQGGDDVTLETTAGTLSDAVTDNGDGTYTATLTSATAPATAVITGAVNGETIQDEATVQFTVGGVSLATSTVEAEPNQIIADGSSSSTITVTLRDPEGNQLTEGGADVMLARTPAEAGELSGVTDNGNGTYTATLTSSTTPETVTITGTVNGEAIEDDATVEFTAGSASTETSTVEADPEEIVADGSSSSTITVTLRDAEGNQLAEGGADVELETTPEEAGELSDVTDAGNGTYTATLTSSTTADTVTITGTVNGDTIADQATVEFTAGSASTATSTVEADPTEIIADGSSTSTITVTLRDAEGNPLSAGGAEVTLVPTAGEISDVIDNGNGTYVAALTSSTTPDTATITGTVDGETIEDGATVVFTVGGASGDYSTITASPGTVVGANTSTIKVELRDAYNNPITTGGDEVSLTTNAGTLSPLPPTDVGDGTYTSTFTPPGGLAGTATITGTVNGVDIEDTATVEFVLTPPSAGQSTIEADPDEIVADGSSTSTITVTLRDAEGSPLKRGGADVTLVPTAGDISAVADNGNGTYMAALTSSMSPEIATIAGTVNGETIQDEATVEFTVGGASGITSTITADPTTLVGANTSAIRVRLRDAYENPIPTGGDDVSLTTNAGNLSPLPPTDLGNGVYTSTFTPPGGLAGTATISGTVNGIPIDDAARIEFLLTPPSAGQSTIEAVPAEIVADGSSTSTVTVTLRDAGGQALNRGGDNVALQLEPPMAGTLSGVLDNGDGTYMAALTSSMTPEVATVRGTVNGETIQDEAAVEFTVGGASGTTSTIAAAPTTVVGARTSTITVRLRDAYNNPIPTGGDVVSLATTMGNLSPSTPTDHGNGTYTSTFTPPGGLTGTAIISGMVNGISIVDTAAVDFLLTPPSEGESKVRGNPNTIVAEKNRSAATVALGDARGSSVTDVGAASADEVPSVAAPAGIASSGKTPAGVAPPHAGDSATGTEAPASVSPSVISLSSRELPAAEWNNG